MTDRITVADLRAELADKPDDAPVAYHAGGHFEYIGDVDVLEPLKTDETTIALEPQNDD